MDEAVNMIDFKAGVKELKKKHFAFIRQELGISKGELLLFDDDEVNEKVYEPMCEIEIEEIPLDDCKEKSSSRMWERIIKPAPTCMQAETGNMTGKP